MNIDQLIRRMKRASMLDVDLYEEVESDTGATGQAAVVVVLSSLAAGIGTMVQQGTTGLLIGTLANLVGWVIWAYLTYLIGTKLLPVERTESDIGETLRTIGFSSAPGILRVVGFVPILGPLVMLGTAVWMLVAMVIAVRQALDYESTGRAVGVCVIGWIIQILFIAMVFAV
jgi:hypothetical protein